MACFHCECKRPIDELMEIRMQERQHSPRTRLEKISNRQEVSNAWNFDFDDNESDGADVAAFEYADSSIMAKGSLDSQAHEDNLRGPEGDFTRTSRVPRIRENEFSDDDTNRPGTGFDDFDDEEDDIDNYELDTPNNNSTRKSPANDFSEVEEYSRSEDFEGLSNNVPARRRTTSPSYNKPSKSARLKATFSGSEDDLDSDEDLSVHPNWKSSHVAVRQRGGRRGQVSPSKGLSFGSDEELGFNSDVDDDSDQNFRSEHKKGNRMGSERRDFQRKRSFVTEETLYSDEDDDDIRSSRNRSRRNKVDIDTRRSKSQGRANENFTRDTKFKSSGKMGGDRRHSFNDDFDEPSQGFRGKSRGSRKTSHDGWRKSDREGNMQDFKGRRRGDSFGKQQRGRRNEYDRDMDGDVGGFKNSRRVIER